MKYISIFLLLLTFSCSKPIKILNKPIIFDQERSKLSLEYLKSHYNLNQEKPTITPKMIVLHWTYISNLEKSFKAFEKIHLPSHRSEIKQASSLNVSAHFLVDYDGVIYKLMPETTMARHVIGLNHCAIGIENVGGNTENPLTKKQVASNIWLVNYLSGKYEIDYLIGHYEYTKFENHELWLEKDAGYRTIKDDPGTDFMKAVREKTNFNEFKKIPE